MLILITVGFVTFPWKAQASNASITINSVSLTLSDDIDGNSFANIGDIIRLEVDVSNTDGGCGVAGTVVTADFTKYGVPGASSMVCVTDNGGVNDSFLASINIADAGVLGIDVIASDSASVVTVLATDTNEAPTMTESVSNALNNPVDSIAPVVSAEAIYVMGGSGSLGAFKFGDIPELHWDTATELDMISSVTINASDFASADSALVASMGAGPTYQVNLSGAMDSQDDINNNITVKVTDDAGNFTYMTGTNNYTIDTIEPTVTPVGNITTVYELPSTCPSTACSRGDIYGVDLVFGEALAPENKAAIEAAITAGATVGAGAAPRAYMWNGARLRVYATEPVSFLHPVTSNLTDLNGNASLSQVIINSDSTAPAITQIQALLQNGGSPNSVTNNWYYYSTEQNIKFRVSTDSPLSMARACVKTLTAGSPSATCSQAGPDNDYEAGTLNVDYVEAVDLGENVYEFNIPLVGYGLPATPGGYPIDLYLKDASGNLVYSTSQATSFGAVFGINPKTMVVMLNNETTTDWSTIDDFTNVSGLTFSSQFESAELGRLTFNSSLDLTASDTITGLQAFGENVTVNGDVMRIDSSALAALNANATLMMRSMSPVRPGLVVKDNAGVIQGYVANDEVGSPTVGGDTLGSFGWNAETQMLTFTTSGFSEFDTDNTPPTVATAVVIGDYSINIVFSEPVNMAAEDFSNFTGTLFEGKNCSANSTSNGSDVNNLYLNCDSPLSLSASGTIDIGGGVMDIVGNHMEPATVTVGIPPSTVYVDDDFTSSSSGGHTWGVEAFSNVFDAIDTVSSGGTVNVAAGTYNVSSSITIDKDISLVGPGIESETPAIIRYMDNNCNYVLSLEASGITVSGLFIKEMEGDGTTYCYNRPAVRVVGEGVTGVTITGNDISGGYPGVQLRYDVSGNTVSDNKIHDNGSGIYISDSTGNTISGNEIYQNQDEGIRLRCGGDCAYVMDGNAINSNDIHDNANGIYVGDDMLAMTTAVVISNNTIDANSCQGIHIGSGVSGMSITGNAITDNGNDCMRTGIETYSIDRIAIHLNTISGNDHGMSNFGGTALDATGNYWGASNGPYNATSNSDGAGDTIGDDISFFPYYTDSDKTVLSDSSPVKITDLDPVEFAASEDDTELSLDVNSLLEGLSGAIPEIHMNVATSVGDVDVQIPTGTTVTGDEGWTGEIHAPTVKSNSSVSIPDATVQRVIEIGFDNILITFDKGVRILIPGQGTKRVGYSHGGAVTEITDVCAYDDQVTGDGLDPGADCKINVSGDMVVWTKHFSRFSTYVTASSGGGSNATQSAPLVYVGSPNGGEILTAGTSFSIGYTFSGSEVSSIRLTLSTDGGSTYTTNVVGNSIGLSGYSWSIPLSIPPTTTAFMKAEALNASGAVLASDVSNAAFTIKNTGYSSGNSGSNGG
ncbi:MAG: right-handed parallel beta-helix repeat-containing protein, partial [bacterium]